MLTDSRSIVLTKAIRMRHCHYCQAPISTAFYLPVLLAWACVPCYVTNIVVPATNPQLESACDQQELDATELEATCSDHKELLSHVA